jgi:DNA-binding MarR family transcriptional regulator
MTDIDDLNIWRGSTTMAWARRAAERWALLMDRAALLYMGLFSASPLPRTETEILVLLWRNPEEGEPAILADKLHVSRQSMTGILDKLETGGYAMRAPHATDRRRKNIRLTDKGAEVVRQFVGSIYRREASLFERHHEVNVKSSLDELERMLSLAEAWAAENPIQGESKNGVEEES